MVGVVPGRLFQAVRVYNLPQPVGEQSGTVGQKGLKIQPVVEPQNLNQPGQHRVRADRPLEKFPEHRLRQGEQIALPFDQP